MTAVADLRRINSFLVLNSMVSTRSVMSVSIREAVAADIPALAELHVKTWNATYPQVQQKPTYEIRERQWREAFEVTDGSWVVEKGGVLLKLRFPIEMLESKYYSALAQATAAWLDSYVHVLTDR